MATVYRKVQGRPGGRIEKAIALHPGVQDWLDDFIFEAGVRAEADLAEHHFEGHSFIDVEKGKVDRYLVLNDERGQKAAMSIEFGREGVEVEEEDGTKKTVGAMEGLFILHKAIHLRPKKKRIVKGELY